MSTLSTELAAEIAKTLRTPWVERDGQKVPASDDIQLGNHAVKLNGTVLYADLADSTKMVDGHKNWFAAEIYKSFLFSAAKIIRARGGTITSYDGDRVMAVFIGESKNTQAARCGLQIQYVVREILEPAILKRHEDIVYRPRHVVGIDTSSLYVARTGIRGSNDLVWVGRAANYAAKMSALSDKFSTYISEDVYMDLNDSAKFGGEPQREMWTKQISSNLGLGIAYYGSSWQSSP